MPNKKVFYGFCLTLALSIFTIARSVLVAPAGDAPADESAIRHITAQQQIFDGWYTGYKKQLDILDYNWAQCQSIVSDYHNDNISLNTVYTRLTLLEHQAQLADEGLQELSPPISLDDTNYDLTTLLLQKTQSYAGAQLETIRALHTAADPANLKAATHEEQSRLLRETMLRTAPDCLFTAPETSALRSRLTLPENS
ncbi:MAG: hypothetical protein MSS66_01660 [Selenomonadaceae bacterium]|nr:hypothetical protein [Selenomonadaceae bacterium]